VVTFFVFSAPAMKFIPAALVLLLAFPAAASGANYCDSPAQSIVHNKSYEEVMQIAKARDRKIIDAECSFTEAIVAIQNEYAGIERYPGRLLIADAHDENFVATRRVGEYTIFSYRYSPRQLLQFALKDSSWAEGDAFQAGAYKIIGVRQFKTPTGFPVKLLVAQGFQFYGPP
jgi:hypothetical protein